MTKSSSSRKKNKPSGPPAASKNGGGHGPSSSSTPTAPAPSKGGGGRTANHNKYNDKKKKKSWKKKRALGGAKKKKLPVNNEQRKQLSVLGKKIKKEENKTQRYLAHHQDVHYAFGLLDILTDPQGCTEEGVFRLQLLGYNTRDEEFAALAPFVRAADESFKWWGDLHLPSTIKTLRKVFGMPTPSPDQPRVALLVYGRGKKGGEEGQLNTQEVAVGGIIVYLRVKEKMTEYFGQRVLVVQLFYVEGEAEERAALYVLVTYALALKAELLLFRHRIKRGDEAMERHWREGYGARVEIDREISKGMKISFDLAAMRALHARYV